MNTVKIEVKPRFTAGTAVAKKIRRAGLIPAVVYGVGTANRSVALDPKPLARAFNDSYGRNQLFDVSVKGESGAFLAIARMIQIDPVSRRLQHADLMVVKPDSAITVSVPVNLVGRSAGVKAGGRLNFTRRRIQVACTPETLPTGIDVQIVDMQIGDAVMVQDLTFPAGVTPIYKKAYKVLDIVQPKGELEEEGEEGEEAVEAEAEE